MLSGAFARGGAVTTFGPLLEVGWIRPKLSLHLGFPRKYPVPARRYSMQISFVASADVKANEGGALVVAASESPALLPAAVRLDKASGGALARAMKFSRFTGKSGQFLEVLAPSGIKASRLILVGLGKAESLDEKALETLGAQIVGRLFAAGESAAS